MPVARAGKIGVTSKHGPVAAAVKIFHLNSEALMTLKIAARQVICLLSDYRPEQMPRLSWKETVILSQECRETQPSSWSYHARSRRTHH